MIPGIMTMMFLYFIMFNMGMTNTYEGLIIAYTVWAVPFCTLMIKGYFDAAIPREIEESARVDGCSQFGTFFRICLPISVPGDHFHCDFCVYTGVERIYVGEHPFI